MEVVVVVVTAPNCIALAPGNMESDRDRTVKLTWSRNNCRRGNQCSSDSGFGCARRHRLGGSRALANVLIAAHIASTLMNSRRRRHSMQEGTDQVNARSSSSLLAWRTLIVGHSWVADRNRLEKGGGGNSRGRHG